MICFELFIPEFRETEEGKINYYSYLSLADSKDYVTYVRRRHSGTLAEWLRRSPAKAVRYACVSSNLTGVALSFIYPLFYLFFAWCWLIIRLKSLTILNDVVMLLLPESLWERAIAITIRCEEILHYREEEWSIIDEANSKHPDCSKGSGWLLKPSKPSFNASKNCNSTLRLRLLSLVVSISESNSHEKTVLRQKRLWGIMDAILVQLQFVALSWRGCNLKSK